MRTKKVRRAPRPTRSTTVGVVAGLLVGGLLIGCRSEDHSGGERGPERPPEAVEAPGPSGSEETPKPVAPALPEPDSASREQQVVTERDESPPSRPPAQSPGVEPVNSAPAEEPAAAVALPEAAADATPEAATDEPPTLDEVLARHGETLRRVRGVIGIEGAECDGAPCIRITVARRTQKLLAQLPPSVEGYPVTVVERRGSH